MAIAAGGLCTIYVVVMLCVPSLPIGIPEGGIARISRAEYWLILLASMETIWNQWTAGYLPTISDRVPWVGCAAVWLAISGVVGWPIARRDGLAQVASRSAALAWSVAVGSPIASLCVAGNAATFGPQSRVGLLVWLVLVGLGLHIGCRRFAPANATNANVDRSICPRAIAKGCDSAMGYSWARRLTGLTGLGIAWVLALTLLGACLPSYDADVREHRVMATRSHYLENRLVRFEHQREANVPQGSMMPALFWMNLMVGEPPAPLDVESIKGLLGSVRVNQITQGMYWCIAIGILMQSLARKYGIFAAVLTSFAIAAHPGFFELVRLGGGAGEGGMVLIAAISLLQSSRCATLPWSSLTCIAAGALGHGWVMSLLVTTPIAIRFIMTPGISQLRRIGWLSLLGAIAVFWGGAFAGPFVKGAILWGRVGEGGDAFLSQYLPFFFSPSSGAGEGALAACSRILFSSSVHSLHLIPIAVLAWCFTRDRATRDTGIGFGLWCLLWWIFTPQQDRDWVIASPLLAWPMASGIVWMRERGLSWLLATISAAALSWSILVLCSWPTSDNRLLVPLDVLASIVEDPETGQGRANGEVAMDFAPEVNRLWNGLGAEQKSQKWLLLGSADAFRWLPKVELYGAYDSGPWGQRIEDGEPQTDPVREYHQQLQRNQIGFIVFDWRGMEIRDRLLGTQRESKFRDAIQKLQQKGALRRVEWEFDSSRAECYEVEKGISSR